MADHDRKFISITGREVDAARIERQPGQIIENADDDDGCVDLDIVFEFEFETGDETLH